MLPVADIKNPEERLSSLLLANISIFVYYYLNYYSPGRNTAHEIILAGKGYPLYGQTGNYDRQIYRLKVMCGTILSPLSSILSYF